MRNINVSKWLSDNDELLVRNRHKPMWIDDVVVPFELPINHWLNLLVVSSYWDIVFSEKLKNLARDFCVDRNPPNMFDALGWLRHNPQCIPIPPAKAQDKTKKKPWYLKKIPKRAYFYWGGAPLSFLRYMSLYSFCHFNPDWEVYLYTPKVRTPKGMNGIIDPWRKTVETQPNFNGMDYLPFVKRLPLRVMPFDFTKIGVPNNIPEAHKADFIRWHLLSTYGGLWSDIDILYFQPVTQVDFNMPDKRKFMGFVYIRKRKHKIGFLLSAPGCKFYAQIFKMAQRRYDKRFYQTIGSDLFDANYPDLRKIQNEFGEAIGNVGDAAVYFLGKQAIYYSFYADGRTLAKAGSVGHHWYAGSVYARELMQELEHTCYLKTRNTSTTAELLKEHFPKGIVI